MSSLHPRALQRFLTSMGKAGFKVKERDSARKALDNHYKKVCQACKKARRPSILKQVQKMKNHVEKLIKKEQQLLGYYPDYKSKADELESRIADLEERLLMERQERALLEEMHKEKVTHMKKDFSYLRGRLKDFINEKKLREKKLQALHDRITKEA